ncbi:MAG TPA: SRPBCC family protein [Flavobacteriales bacterium]|nr:SRPBCC family protein [Flavobacteriales bacterium]
MKKRELNYNFASADLIRVYEAIVDLRKYGNYHPVMTSVEIVGDKGGNIEYEVKEKIKILGFIPMKPVYRVTVNEVEKGRIIRYDSTVKKNVKLEIVFTFNQSSQGLQVKEEITVTAGWPIAGIFMNLLEKMHVKVMNNIKNPNYKK